MQGTMQRLNARAGSFGGRALPVTTVRPVQAAAPKRTALRVQSLRVNNVEIPNSKRIEFSLQYIYGIGKNIAKDIILETGIENKKTYELNEEEVNRIREEVGKYTTESDLRRIVTMNIKRLKDIGCYRGRRHIMVSSGSEDHVTHLFYA
ncbi:plastid ribosomal protein S13 [Dunaliella salina]|uniref:Plastid ribosomal protein S13 n=1 Tax=Dunaliella salina TaxID=3046 RepID=A0ABQ7FUN1_DUNSA|nr:plastid ribosomal protein S13 [Dunaliella salina]|eukprot:KAF5826114.1 plastid ribosomal protein S13 [Dunaliella salina]